MRARNTIPARGITLPDFRLVISTRPPAYRIYSALKYYKFAPQYLDNLGNGVKLRIAVFRKRFIQASSRYSGLCCDFGHTPGASSTVFNAWIKSDATPELAVFRKYLRMSSFVLRCAGMSKCLVLIVIFKSPRILRIFSPFLMSRS